MEFFKNTLKSRGLPDDSGMAEGNVCINPDGALALFAKCPVAKVSPLLNVPEIAERLSVAAFFVKDERERMGLGSFKSLGAAFAIAKAADKAVFDGAMNFADALTGHTYVCASAGNHGLSMAAGARVFGANAVVYLSSVVPKEFADRLTIKGATVVRAGDTYEASMDAALAAASDQGWELLSDSSWEGYSQMPRDVMEGYLIMGAEVADQLDSPPTHIFLQAGVGGLAAACTAAARHYWGDMPKIYVVEPDFAPALFDSIKAARTLTAQGSVSIMGRLDCKEPSHLALKYLAKEADGFITITEDESRSAVDDLEAHSLRASPSATAGYAGILCAKSKRDNLELTSDSRILIFLTEAAVEE